MSRQTVWQNLDTQINFEHKEYLNTTGRENPGKEAPQDGIGREDTENVAPQNNPTDSAEVPILPTPSSVASGGQARRYPARVRRPPQYYSQTYYSCLASQEGWWCNGTPFTMICACTDALFYCV